jgi:hypothetical protein
MRIHGTLVGILAACSVLTVTTAYAADPVIVEDAPVAEQVSPGWTVAVDPFILGYLASMVTRLSSAMISAWMLLRATYCIILTMS